MDDTIGIDVSKDKLDIFDMKHRQFANGNDGLISLMRWLKGRTALVIFEASGYYYRQLETKLSAARLPYSKVNPRQARRFAEGEPLMRHWFEHNGDRKDRKD